MFSVVAIMKMIHPNMPNKFSKALLLTLPVALSWVLAQPASAQTLTPLTTATSDTPAPPWRIVGLPNTGKNLTHFDVVTLEGQRVLRISADNSYANLVHELPALALTPGTLLHWRWRLDQPLPLADLTRKSGDDVPIKVCAMFDMPLTTLGLVERNLVRLARSLSHEYLPGATLCYIWDNRLPVGTQLPNAFTRRVRYLVLDSGTSQLKQWVTHERDLAADFQQAFGHEAAGLLPPLMAILLGADSDNIDGLSLAYASDLVLTRHP